MKIEIEVPDYNENVGFVSEWEEDYEIKVIDTKDYIEIYANKDGLISLAKHFLNLAQDAFPKAYHLHYDDSNSLEEGSKHLIMCKL